MTTSSFFPRLALTGVLLIASVSAGQSEEFDQARYEEAMARLQERTRQRGEEQNQVELLTQRIASLEREVVRLRSENQRLRAQLGLSGESGTRSSTNTPRVPSSERTSVQVYTSGGSIMATIPPNLLPPMGQSWGRNLDFQLLQEWIEKEVSNARFDGRVPLRWQSLRNERGNRVVVMTLEEVIEYRGKLVAVEYEAHFEASENMERLRTLEHGAQVAFTGEISRARLYSRDMRFFVDGGMETDGLLKLTLQNCKLR